MGLDTPPQYSCEDYVAKAPRIQPGAQTPQCSCSSEEQTSPCHSVWGHLPTRGMIPSCGTEVKCKNCSDQWPEDIFKFCEIPRQK